MSHYKPYPAYKDSGVEWIGDVPEHWPLLRLANVGSLMKANGGNRQDDTDNGVPCIRYGDLYTIYDLLIRHIGKFISPTAETDYTDIKYGDILFAASGETFEEIGKSAVNLTETYACCGGDVIVLRPQRKIDPVYLAYAAGSSSAQAQKSLMGKGFTVIHIYGNQLRNLVIAAPSEQEQKLIGAKVESETTRIDTLISKKTRFIELLQEKRSALITHAVTKGLDPNMKMKDSGVEWIGQVPEHWGVKRLRHVASFKNSNVDKKAYDDQEAVNLCNYTDVYYNEFITPDLSFMQATASAAEIEQFSLKKGDVLITKDSEDPSDIGIPSFVAEEMPGVVCGYHLTMIRGDDFDTARLLHRILQSHPTQAHFFVEAPGITRYGLSQDAIGDLCCCLPPKMERCQIADHLDRETTRIDALIAKTQRSIDLLKERRSTFITAAVTGQIDLRGEIA